MKLTIDTILKALDIAIADAQERKEQAVRDGDFAEALYASCYMDGIVVARAVVAAVEEDK